MANIKSNHNCPNKNCFGGVITTNGATGRACTKCNPKKKTLDKYYWHEALDRTAIVANLIDSILLNHPIFNQKDSIRNKQLRQRVEKAQKLILETYQDIGEISI